MPNTTNSECWLHMFGTNDRQIAIPLEFRRNCVLVNAVCETVNRPKTSPKVDETPYAYSRLRVLHAMNLRRRLSGIPESTIAGNAAVLNTVLAAPFSDATNHQINHAVNLHRRLSGSMDSPRAWMAELHVASENALHEASDDAFHAATNDAYGHQ